MDGPKRNEKKKKTETDARAILNEPDIMSFYYKF